MELSADRRSNGQSPNAAGYLSSHNEYGYRPPGFQTLGEQIKWHQAGGEFAGYRDGFVPGCTVVNRHPDGHTATHVMPVVNAAIDNPMSRGMPSTIYFALFSWFDESASERGGGRH